MMNRAVSVLVFLLGAVVLMLSVLWPVEKGGGSAPFQHMDNVPRIAEEIQKTEPLPVKDAAADYYDLSFTVRLAGRESLLLTTGFPAGVFLEIVRGRARVGFVAGGTFLERTSANLRSADTYAVLLRRRGEFYDVAVDNVMVGGISFRSGGDSEFKLIGKAARVEDLSFRPVRDPVVFGDDFMREAAESSPWERISGKWENIGLKHPSLSANPFRLSSVGAEAATVVGRPYWDSYQAGVSMRGAAGQKMGVIFAYRGGEDYCLFRWTAGSSRDGGKAELISYRNGGRTTVAEKEGGYAPGVWYKVELTTGMGWARVYVDEQLMFEVFRPGITGGGFGLYSDGVNRTYFDDVVIGPYLEALHNGQGAFRYFRPLSGDWHEDMGGIRARVAGAGGFPAVYSSDTVWREWNVKAEILSGQDCGVAAAVADPLNFIGFIRRGGDAVLLERRSGRETVLASRPLGGTAGRVEMTLTTARSIAKGRAVTPDGRVVELSAPVGTELRGGAGLVTVSGSAEFSPVLRASIPKRQEAVLTGNATFSSEGSMSTWAGEMRDWYLGKEGAYWYRGFLAGDVEVTAELGERDLSASGTIALGVHKSGDSTQPMNGYVATLKAADPAHDAAGTEEHTGRYFDVRLYREGEELEAKTLNEENLYTVGLATVGDTVSCHVNGLPLISYMDPRASEIKGYKVAFKLVNAVVKPDNVLVSSRGMHDYSFNTAPTDWRVAAGEWDVTNRWQCDPRWSFFSGQVKEGDKRVVIWNKRRFGDPVRIEFYAAPKMRRELGNRYEYVRDINVALCMDGADFTKGYSFIYGGYNNTKNAIIRNGNIVAATNNGLINRSMRIHRHWFHVVVEKEGDEITFDVDNGTVHLTFKDPEPLDVGRVAIWSYDCSVMISRVRISGGGGAMDEAPGYVPDGPVRTIYDLETDGSVQEGRN
ncbi:MAG: hypothetical protein JW909_12020 [Planctomycetes bacterium]|nr:hypothetical protein [Planctomycetota bacterium]